MKYLHMRLPELLEARGISRTRLCKDLDLQRTNLNRYYRDNFRELTQAWWYAYVNILVVMSQICLRYGNVNSDTKGHQIGKAAEESDYGSNPAI